MSWFSVGIQKTMLYAILIKIDGRADRGMPQISS